MKIVPELQLVCQSNLRGLGTAKFSMSLSSCWDCWRQTTALICIASYYWLKGGQNCGDKVTWIPPTQKLFETPLLTKITYYDMNFYYERGGGVRERLRVKSFKD